MNLPLISLISPSLTGNVMIRTHALFELLQDFALVQMWDEQL